LVERLRVRHFRLLDTQWMTPHLRQFGGYELTRHQYTAALREVLAVEAGASPL
jgi:leucyl/phenylalanyl-tRNA--protein transferase